MFLHDELMFVFMVIENYSNNSLNTQTTYCILGIFNSGGQDIIQWFVMNGLLQLPTKRTKAKLFLSFNGIGIGIGIGVAKPK